MQRRPIILYNYSVNYVKKKTKFIAYFCAPKMKNKEKRMVILYICEKL